MMIRNVNAVVTFHVLNVNRRVEASGVVFSSTRGWATRFLAKPRFASIKIVFLSRGYGCQNPMLHPPFGAEDLLVRLFPTCGLGRVRLRWRDWSPGTLARSLGILVCVVSF